MVVNIKYVLHTISTIIAETYMPGEFNSKLKSILENMGESNDGDFWKAEATRREKEMEAAARLEKSKNAEAIRKLLYSPTKEVVAHLEKQLELHPNDEGIRRLALSFDSLQRNIMRAINEPNMQRVSKELFTKPN